MNLKHLDRMMPSFLEELSKEAGIKEDLKSGTKKVLTALKDVPKKANDTAIKAMVKMHAHPVGSKILTEGPEIARRLLT